MFSCPSYRTLLDYTRTNVPTSRCRSPVESKRGITPRGRIVVRRLGVHGSCHIEPPYDNELRRDEGGVARPVDEGPRTVAAGIAAAPQLTLIINPQYKTTAAYNRLQASLYADSFL